jgi:hypothetical protein
VTEGDEEIPDVVVVVRKLGRPGLLTLLNPSRANNKASSYFFRQLPLVGVVVVVVEPLDLVLLGPWWLLLLLLLLLAVVVSKAVVEMDKPSRAAAASRKLFMALIVVVGDAAAVAAVVDMVLLPATPNLARSLDCLLAYLLARYHLYHNYQSTTTTTSDAPQASQHARTQASQHAPHHRPSIEISCSVGESVGSRRSCGFVFCWMRRKASCRQLINAYLPYLRIF